MLHASCARCVFVLGVRPPAPGGAEDASMRAEWLARCGVALPQELAYVYEVRGVAWARGHAVQAFLSPSISLATRGLA